MKMNWGTAIALSFTCFCGLMVFMVVKSFEQDFHLVSQQYYSDELQYQNRIEELERTRDAGKQVVARVEEEQVTFIIADDPEAVGKVHFYRPDNAAYDHLATFDQGHAIIAKNQLAPGRYIAKISWQNSSDSYYQEQELIIK